MTQTLDSRIFFAEHIEADKLWYKDLPRDVRSLSPCLRTRTSRD